MWRVPTTAALVWVSLVGWQAVSDAQAYGTLGLTSQSDWPCVASMVIGGVMLGGPLVWMLRRGAPLTPRTTAFLAGLAALSLANIEACLTRPHAFAMTVLLWHGGTIALTVGLSASLGRRWLPWPPLARLRRAIPEDVGPTDLARSARSDLRPQRASNGGGLTNYSSIQLNT